MYVAQDEAAIFLTRQACRGAKAAAPSVLPLWKQNMTMEWHGGVTCESHNVGERQFVPLNSPLSMEYSSIVCLLGQLIEALYHIVLLTSNA